MTPFFFYKKRQNRQVFVRIPKFCLFDVGIVGTITKRPIAEERGELFGKAFEHFIFIELSAYNSYNELNYDINFWKTKSGLEVDFVLAGGQVAIEVKGTAQINKRDLRSIKAFAKDYSLQKALIVCNEREERISDTIRIMPCKNFLHELWDGRIIS